MLHGYTRDHLILCYAGSFLVIELNDFGVLTSWFILKAHTSDIAKKWMDHINSAQVAKTKVAMYIYIYTICMTLLVLFYYSCSYHF